MEDRRLADRFKHYMKVGALSAILLAQSVQAVQAAPLLEHVTRGPDSGPVAAHVVQAPASSVELVNPLERSATPGVVTDRGFDAMEMLNQWRAGGVGDQELYELTQVLVATQSPVLVSSEKAKESVWILSNRTSAIFSVEDQASAIDFLNGSSLFHLEQEGLVIPGAYDHQGPDLAVTSETTMEFWQSLGRLGTSQAPASAAGSQQSAVEFGEAIDALKSTMKDTGIHSLRVPAPMWTSSSHLKSVAGQLTDANLEMQKLTGWDGQVLGLKGNVDMTLASPGDSAAAWLNGHGRVEVIAGMGALVHEVLAHGVDFMVAQKAGHVPSAAGIPGFHGYQVPVMSMAIRDPAGALADGHSYLTKTWEDLDGVVTGTMEGWIDSLPSEYSQLVHGSHIEAPWERIAYSMEGFVVHKLGEDSILVDTTSSLHSITPSGQAAADLAPAWEQAFEALNESWWEKLPSVEFQQEFKAPAPTEMASHPDGLSSAPIQVEIPSMSSWRQARAAGSEASGPQVSVARSSALGSPGW